MLNGTNKVIFSTANMSIIFGMCKGEEGFFNSEGEKLSPSG